jgi:hypothetical protein
MLESLKQNIKNVVGWKTKRKIVVFSVDDYGNVRVASKEARERLNQAGYKARGVFDAYDTLENSEDLEMLYEALSSVKGGDGTPAVFTPFAVPCNIDFEKLKEENYSRFQYELLPQTYDKLMSIDPTAYQGAWDLWKEGIQKGLMVPQFHGREHLNIQVFEDKLKNKDKELLTVLQNRSYTGLSTPGYKRIGQTAAFGFWNFEDNYKFESIIKDGLEAFEKVFGYRSLYFNAPAGNEHEIIYKYLGDNGVRYVDVPLIKKEHQGQGKYKSSFNYIGKRHSKDILFLVRNVVFEPSDDNTIDWVNLAFNQIDRAFRWNKPAIISSHRVNFCGHIDPQNRKVGLDALEQLLKKIVQKWPEVEFMSADRLGNIIASER